jgi:membrane protein YqaA with SNARE-associated domain
MWEILGALLIGTAVSGIVPIVNAELLVVAAAVAVPAVGLPLVVVVSTVGQMITKTLLFALARWAPGKLPARARAALDRAAAAVSAREGSAGSLVFASAATGLPPFYGVSLACGVIRMRLGTFLFAGGAGRALRFGVLAWLAHRLGEGGAALLAERATSFLVGV